MARRPAAALNYRRHPSLAIARASSNIDGAMQVRGDNEPKVAIHDGLQSEHTEDALRISYEAFSRKFSFGFRNRRDYVRLFHDQVDHPHCITATVDGQLAGILTIQTNSHEFYGFSVGKTFARFNPIRAMRIMLNLAIFALESRPTDDELVVETLVVDARFRGMGIGTRLLTHAEHTATKMGKQRMTLDVIDENEGARRLYERLGFRKIAMTEGIGPLRLSHIMGTRAVHKMEKPINRTSASV